MEKKHEPAPWILGGASGRMITTKSGYYGDGFIADVDTLANAKYIVTAVNAHYEMLEALKIVIDFPKEDVEYYLEHGVTMTLNKVQFQQIFDAIKKANPNQQ